MSAVVLFILTSCARGDGLLSDDGADGGAGASIGGSDAGGAGGAIKTVPTAGAAQSGGSSGSALAAGSSGGAAMMAGGAPIAGAGGAPIVEGGHGGASIAGAGAGGAPIVEGGHGGAPAGGKVSSEGGAPAGGKASSDGGAPAGGSSTMNGGSDTVTGGSSSEGGASGDGGTSTGAGGGDPIIDCSSPSVVISAIYGGGGNTKAPFNADYIELFNRTSAPVDLTGWTVQYGAASGATISNATALKGTIPSGGYLLVEEAKGTTGSNLPKPDVIASSDVVNLSATHGRIALVSGAKSLDSTCKRADVVDFVGYGSDASCSEGAPATAPDDNTKALVRRGDGCVDSGHNDDDFDLEVPTPRTSKTPLAPCGCP